MCVFVCLFVCVTGINFQTRRATDLKFSQVNHYLMRPIVSYLIFLRNLLKGTFVGNHLWIIPKVSYSKIMPHVSRIIFLQLLHYLWAKIMRHVRITILLSTNTSTLPVPSRAQISASIYIYSERDCRTRYRDISKIYREKNIDNQPDLILPGSENVSMICHTSHPKSIPKLHCHCHPAPKDNPI